MESENCNKKMGTLAATWRRSAGLSQIDLADILGTQQATISKLENGMQKMTVENLLSILHACGLTLQETADEIEAAYDGGKTPLWERIDE